MARSYYLFRSGRLRRRQNTLYLESEQDGQRQRRPIPVEDVRDIYVFSELELNTKLLNFLAQAGIPVHFFNYYGYYTGTFYPRESNVSGHLLVQQVAHYRNGRRRLRIARQFVYGAIYHIRRNLRYYRNRGREIGDIIAVVEANMAQVKTAPDIATLMSLEGQSRDAYYGAFNQIMDLPEPFTKRVRRPPDNLLNAMISFGNALAYSAALSEIYVTQLNPTISYLHEPSERRFSLALDIAEIFKPLLVDRLIFRLINRKMLNPDRHTQAVGGAKGVYLNEDGRKLFVREWEAVLQQTVRHRSLKRNVSYRQLMRIECYKLVRHLIGVQPYRVLKAWW